jgi:hypothetical protein
MGQSATSKGWDRIPKRWRGQIGAESCPSPPTPMRCAYVEEGSRQLLAEPGEGQGYWPTLPPNHSLHLSYSLSTPVPAWWSPAWILLHHHHVIVCRDSRRIYYIRCFGGTGRGHRHQHSMCSRVWRCCPIAAPKGSSTRSWDWQEND